MKVVAMCEPLEVPTLVVDDRDAKSFGPCMFLIRCQFSDRVGPMIGNYDITQTKLLPLSVS